MKIIKRHIPCPCGKSSDAYCIYEDGHGHCFRCNKTTREEVVENDKNTKLEYLPFNGLSENTVKFYNILTKLDSEGREIQRGYIYPNESVKIEFMQYDDRKDKFRTKGEINKGGLFGMDKFPSGSKSSITITEGEKDAPSYYEALDGHSACVSVQSSSTAIRDIRNNFDYINSFKKIIIAFDGDEAGQNAAKKVLTLFDPRKVYNLCLSQHKDANDYAKSKQLGELAEEWKHAKKFTNDNFISTFPEVADSLVQSRNDVVASYPLKELQEALRGLLRGELTVFKGLEGIGKTEFFRAMEYHILKNHPGVRVGLIHMEEDRSITIKGIATYESQYPHYFEEDGVTPEETLEAYRKAVNEEEDRVFIYKITGGDDPDEILASIRSLVVTSEVDIIFLDNLNKMVDSLEETDERQKLVYIASKLKSMAMDLKCSMVVISHVNDDGKTLGSRYTAKVADKVVHMDRKITSMDEVTKNSTYFTIEKGRMAKRTGKGGIMIFNPDTFTLKEREDE